MTKKDAAAVAVLMRRMHGHSAEKFVTAMIAYSDKSSAKRSEAWRSVLVALRQQSRSRPDDGSDAAA